MGDELGTTFRPRKSDVRWASHDEKAYPVFYVILVQMVSVSAELGFEGIIRGNSIKKPRFLSGAGNGDGAKPNAT